MNATQYLIKTAYYNKIKDRFGNNKFIMDFVNSNEFNGKQNKLHKKLDEMLANGLITPEEHKELKHISGQGSKTKFKAERDQYRASQKETPEVKNIQQEINLNNETPISIKKLKNKAEERKRFKQKIYNTNIDTTTKSGNSVLNWMKENKIKTGIGAGALTLAGGYGVYKARQNREENGY